MKCVKVKIEAGHARSIHLREIPKSLYEGMKLLNKNSGAMSLVFEKDENTVRVFTRDEIKYEWLCQPWGLGIGKVCLLYTSPSPRD